MSNNLYYSGFGLLAIILHLIVSYKYFSGHDKRVAMKEYRRFLISILCYFVADMMWGIFAEYNLRNLLYLGTVAYYVFMGLSVMFCGRSIIAFLKLKDVVATVMNACGLIFVVCEMIAIVYNHFHHFFFWFDNDGAYHAYGFRFVVFIAQIILYGSVVIASLVMSIQGNIEMRRRNITTFLFALSMTVALILQTCYPLLPIYTMGLVVGIMIVHIFIHNEDIIKQMQLIEGLNAKLMREREDLKKQKDDVSTALGIIKGLSHDFHSIWVADKETMHIELVRQSSETVNKNALRMALESENSREALAQYIAHYVCEEDRQRIMETVSPERIQKELSTSDFYAVNFRRLKENGEMDYIQVVFANADTVDGKKQMVFGFRDVNDIVHQEVALRKERAANVAKTKFLHNMSHEIRTPLNAMFGFSQLLGMPDGSCTEEEKAQYNAIIYNSYRMLDMLISDILDIADSEHGNYRIDTSDVNINEVCRNALMSVEYRVPGDVKLYMTTDFANDYCIKSDERRIQQVLINYLTNACKNTQHGEIHLHASRTEHPGQITFSVTDTGRGVPPENADLIFQRFTKLDQHVQGSGLGLSICMIVADKLGGKVFLDKSYTTGARFVFVLEDKK